MISSEDFTRELLAESISPGSDKSPRISSCEVDEWLELFGDIDESEPDF